MPSLFLTFDDGPDPEWTPVLLDLLADLGAGAAFFPIASRAAAQPGLVARMLAEGHTVGVHCDQHVRHSERDRDCVRADTARALRTLRSLGAEPELWRTPWGDLAPWSEPLAVECRLRLVGWSVDTHDWRGDAAGRMFEDVAPDLDDGAIVLAHDGIGPGALRSTSEETIELVRLIASHAGRRGLRLGALA